MADILYTVWENISMRQTAELIESVPPAGALPVANSRKWTDQHRFAVIGDEFPALVRNTMERLGQNAVPWRLLR